jgi:hypothetical protein
MIAEFEARLAEVLRGVLPAPFTGRVEASPPDNDDPPLVVLGVRRAEPLEPDFGSRRPELAPGANGHRRIVRLACTVGLQVVPSDGEGRAEALRGVDALLFALEAPQMRDGSALASAGDPGFLIHDLRVVEAGAPFTTEAETLEPPGLTARAEGWFWPIGTPGETGREIVELHVRGSILPLEISVSPSRIVAGGDAVELTVRLGELGPLRVRENGPAALPFGSLAFFVAEPGGNAPGAGTLSGGAAGAGGTRIVGLADGAASVSYTPPDEASRAELVVGLEDGENGLGLELGRLPLVVRGA